MSKTTHNRQLSQEYIDKNHPNMANHSENKAVTSGPAPVSSHSWRKKDSFKTNSDDACTKAYIVSDKTKPKKPFTAPLMRNSRKRFEHLQTMKPHIPVAPRPKPTCPVVVKPPMAPTAERLAEVCQKIKSKVVPPPKKAILYYNDADPLKIKTTAAQIFRKPAQDTCGSSSKMKVPEKHKSAHIRSTAIVNKASQSAPQDCRAQTAKTSAAPPSAQALKRVYPTEESTSKQQCTDPSIARKVPYKRTRTSDDEDEGLTPAKRLKAPPYTSESAACLVSSSSEDEEEKEHMQSLGLRAIFYH